MNKKIPELLEYGDEIVITNEVSRMFDPEEIKELTMNKIHQSEQRTSHTGKFAAVLCAAALVAALTATAFATYHFIIAEQFNGYFDGLTEQQAEVIDQIGTGKISPSTASGTTLTPLAVIGDDRNCYAKFRMEAPATTQFPTTSEDLKFLHIFGPSSEDRYSLVDENGESLPISYAKIEWIDSTPGDNILDFVVQFSSNLSHPAHFNDGRSKTLTIKGLWMEGLDKEYTKVLEGPWSFDIGFYSAVEERTLDVDGLDVKRLFNGVEYGDEGMSMTLRFMSISPLTLTYAYDFTCPDSRVTPGPGTILIIMKDGSMVETLRGDGSWTDSYICEEAIIQAPIELKEVDYVQFGNKQIKVS